MATEEELASDYASSLADLTVNSKPLINMLTMLAEENVETAAAVIVKVIEKHLSQVKPEMKLPVLYLVDSIVKNIGDPYTTLFTQNIVSTFCSVFEKVEESTRASMFKLRQTWSDVFPPKKLYALDVRVKSIDPAWPVTAPPPTSIHLNPAFLPKKDDRLGYKPNPTKKSGANHAAKPLGVVKPPVKHLTAPVKLPSAVTEVPVMVPQELCETEMRESLLRKQKELLELQQKKLELELLQTKARLQKQQIQLVQQPPDVVQTSWAPPSEERSGVVVPDHVQSSALPICEPEPMELSTTPPHMESLFDDIVPPQPPTIGSLAGLNQHQNSSRSPNKKKDKDKDRGDPHRKKSRKDSDREDSGRSSKRDSGSSRSRKEKGKEQSQALGMMEVEPAATSNGDDEVTVVSSTMGQSQSNRPSMREAAKSMPRIPKLSQRAPPSSGLPNNSSRDPRMLKQVQQGVVQEPVHGDGGGDDGRFTNEEDVQVVADYRSPGRRSRNHNNNKCPPSLGIQAERRKMDGPKKDGSTEAKKRRPNRFDDLFGVEDIDLRTPGTAAVPSAPGAASIPPAVGARDSPPLGSWTGQPSKRGGPRGERGWPPIRGGRGGGRGVLPGGPREEEERDLEGAGSGSPRNMDFILEQAKENHRNGVITDSEYSTVIRQVFHMSETKMIREAQRRESFPGPGGPPHHPPLPGPGPGPNDFRFGGRDGGPPSRRFGPEDDRGWNDPRHRGDRGFPDRGFHPGPPGPGGRMPRYDMLQPPRGPMDGRPMGGPRSPNMAFEVRPDDDMRTIPIDNIPREIRFYDDKAVILMAADDPRLLGFQPCARGVLIDNVPLPRTATNERFTEFVLDGQMHQIKLGEPTRELYIDDKWYECMFGGPPITINIGGRPAQIALEGPPPIVKIGQEQRFDLLAGRVTMIIDAHSVIPVYLDLKLQHFELEGQLYTMQFKDSLRTVVIDGQAYRVDFGGLPMPINLGGMKHFVRFSSLPRGVEPGRVLQPLALGNHVERPPMEQETNIPPREAQAPLASLGTLNVSELLSKLMATGLLPNSAPDSVTPPVKEEIKKEEKIIEVNLKDPESMKVRPTGVISFMYSGMQCGSCGLRFPADQTVRYSTHLDWHFRQNRREKGAAKRPQSRKWYCSMSDWIQFEETENSDEKRLNFFETQAKEKSEKDGDRNGDESSPEETSVVVGNSPEENKCFVCHEDLDQFFHEENEEWHLKDAVRIEGITYHRLCHRDHLVNMETGSYVPFHHEEDEGSTSEQGDDPAASSQEEAMCSEGETTEKKIFIKQEEDGSQSAADSLPEFPKVEEKITEAIKAELEDDDSIMKLIKAEPDESEKVDHFDDVKENLESVEQPQVPLTDLLASTWESSQDGLSNESDEPPKEDLNQPMPEEAMEEGPNAVDEEMPLYDDRVDDQPVLDDVDEATKQLMESLISTTSPLVDQASNEPLNDLIGTVNSPSGSQSLSSPPPPPVDEESSSNQEASLPPQIQQTPTVVSSIDGNVEMATQQTVPAAGFKIKINLFNKAASSSPIPAEPAAPSPVLSAPAPPTAATAETESTLREEMLIPSPPDDAALTNKPRLIGRKLTVLPLMTKGVETSGLCSIM